MTTTTEPLLRLDRLTKEYGDYRALDQLSISVAPGEVFGLLGPNGSGKSTALRLVLGFLKPTEGDAWIGGHHCWRDSVAARRQIAYLPGELRLYENMTGRQLIRFLSRLRGRPPKAEIDALARRFDINLERPLAQLSSGMKRKVALLQVLVAHAPLVILDEPTNALDPTMRAELLGQIETAREQGQTVVFSSHVLAEVEQVCDRVGILRLGKLVHLQPLAELQAGRFIAARFAGVPVTPPDLPGVTVRLFQQGRLELEQAGPPGPILDWLARQELLDLTVRPLGLSGIYTRYHRSEA